MTLYRGFDTILSSAIENIEPKESVMIVPIVSIPPSIANGLEHYKDLFPRSETFQHIPEYCTGIVVLDKPIEFSENN